MSNITELEDIYILPIFYIFLPNKIIISIIIYNNIFYFLIIIYCVLCCVVGWWWCGVVVILYVRDVTSRGSSACGLAVSYSLLE